MCVLVKSIVGTLLSLNMHFSVNEEDEIGNFGLEICKKKAFTFDECFFFSWELLDSN